MTPIIVISPNHKTFMANFSVFISANTNKPPSLKNLNYQIYKYLNHMCKIDY